MNEREVKFITSLPESEVTGELAGLTCDQWREKYELRGGELLHTRGKRAGTVAGGKHPSGWIHVLNGTVAQRKDAVWLIKHGWLPAGKRTHTVVRLDGSDFNDAPDNLGLLSYADAHYYIRRARKEWRGKAPVSAPSPDPKPVAQAEEKSPQEATVAAVAGVRVGSTLECSPGYEEISYGVEEDLGRRVLRFE